jgi:hypothetical protein
VTGGRDGVATMYDMEEKGQGMEEEESSSGGGKWYGRIVRGMVVVGMGVVCKWFVVGSS